MKNHQERFDRRDFIKKSSIVAFGTTGLLTFPPRNRANALSDENDINIIGPKEGYTPQIGTMVSMMNWMRKVVLFSVQGLHVKDLDYLHDAKSNTIGALLFHLAATERFYQIHTFEGRRWGNWTQEEELEWGVASRLGDEARETIKGNDLAFYLEKLKDVRKNTLQEFSKRDDNWLMEVDEAWSWGPTNNYCKWFHVCEHESNHNGQIKWLKRRLPSAKKND